MVIKVALMWLQGVSKVAPSLNSRAPEVPPTLRLMSRENFLSNPSDAQVSKQGLLVSVNFFLEREPPGVAPRITFYT